MSREAILARCSIMIEVLIGQDVISVRHYYKHKKTTRRGLFLFVIYLLGIRLMVGHLTLTQGVVVRIHHPQPLQLLQLNGITLSWYDSIRSSILRQSTIYNALLDKLVKSSLSKGEVLPVRIRGRVPNKVSPRSSVDQSSELLPRGSVVRIHPGAPINVVPSVVVAQLSVKQLERVRFPGSTHIGLQLNGITMP